MDSTDTALEGVKIISPNIFFDARGCFYESYNERKFSHIVGNDVKFLQDNTAYSTKGVLRGLHYQVAPFAQSKLLSILYGEIFDVVVDLRSDSATYLRHETFILSCKCKRQIYIPRGFAHGYLTLSEEACIQYKVDNYYSAEHERAISWSDPILNIKWPDGEKLLSDKDRKARNIE